MSRGDLKTLSCWRSLGSPGDNTTFTLSQSPFDAPECLKHSWYITGEVPREDPDCGGVNSLWLLIPRVFALCRRFPYISSTKMQFFLSVSQGGRSRNERKRTLIFRRERHQFAQTQPLSVGHPAQVALCAVGAIEVDDDESSAPHTHTDAITRRKTKIFDPRQRRKLEYHVCLRARQTV